MYNIIQYNTYMYISFLPLQTNTPSTDTCQQFHSLSYRKLSTMKPQNKDSSLGDGFCLDMTFSLLVKWKHHWICEARRGILKLMKVTFMRQAWTKVVGWGTQRFIGWLVAAMEGGLNALRFCTCVLLTGVLFTWLPWGPEGAATGHWSCQACTQSQTLCFHGWLEPAVLPFAGAVFCSLGQLQFPLDNPV